MNIILTGYRCTGKTTVGKSLAAACGWVFVDTDEELMRKNGRSVREIVERDGWAVFRKLESDTIREVCGLDRRVIAAGGGAVLSTDNVAVMRKSGRIVWLKARPDTIRARMTADTATDGLRPALTSRGPWDEIGRVLAGRSASYEAAADFSVDTDGRSIVEIVDTILCRTTPATGEH
jgi:shikimate kinase